MRQTLLILLLAASSTAQPLRLDQTIPLGNIKGRIGHMSADVAGKRIFIAESGNNTVEVVSLAEGQVVHTISGLGEPQAVFYWPKNNRLYVSTSQDGHVRVYDGRSFEQIGDYDFNNPTDEIRIDPNVDEIFIGYGDGALGVINSDLKSRVGTTELDAHPASFQLEKDGLRIFINVPATSAHVTVVDRRTRSVIAKWPLSAQLNFPMALDEPNRRLFVGCRKPPGMLVLDTSNGHEVASVPIVKDADDLFYDATLKRIYISGADSLTVVQQKDSDHYESIATVPTAHEAQISLFVPELRRLYVARPHRGKQEAALLVYSVSQ